MSFYGKVEKFRLNNNNNNNEETLGNYKGKKATHCRKSTWSQQDTVTVAEQNMIYDSMAWCEHKASI